MFDFSADALRFLAYVAAGSPALLDAFAATPADLVTVLGSEAARLDRLAGYATNDLDRERTFDRAAALRDDANYLGSFVESAAFAARRDLIDADAIEAGIALAGLRDLLPMIAADPSSYLDA